LIKKEIIMMKIFHVLGFAGSLRESSFNRGLLVNACEVLPEGLELEVIELNEIPLYNDDQNKDHLPKALTEFREKIIAADALLIASPEYNYSITGVLKNALDWVSSNTFGNIISGKTIAIMGASRGLVGTARGQLHLRQVLHAMNARPLIRPEVYVRRAGELFDESGNLIDTATIEKIRELLYALLETLKSK
jgi:chromate reductase